jgi:glutathione S-transferase
VKLYYIPREASMAAHIVAREAGCDVELVKVDFPTRRTERGDDYWQVTAKGYVPALELDDGRVLTEVAVVMQYLADGKPEADLVPPWGTFERYRLLEALNFVATEVHKPLATLFYPAMTAEMKAFQRGYLRRRLDALAAELDDRDYVVGDRFGIADAYLFTVLHWAGPLDIDLAPWSNVAAYVSRIGARPAVADTMRIEGPGTFARP